MYLDGLEKFMFSRKKNLESQLSLDELVNSILSLDKLENSLLSLENSEKSLLSLDNPYNDTIYNRFSLRNYNFFYPFKIESAAVLNDCKSCLISEK